MEKFKISEIDDSSGIGRLSVGHSHFIASTSLDEPEAFHHRQTDLPSSSLLSISTLAEMIVTCSADFAVYRFDHKLHQCVRIANLKSFSCFIPLDIKIQFMNECMNPSLIFLYHFSDMVGSGKSMYRKSPSTNKKCCLLFVIILSNNATRKWLYLFSTCWRAKTFRCSYSEIFIVVCCFGSWRQHDSIVYYTGENFGEETKSSTTLCHSSSFFRSCRVGNNQWSW